jgi:23S rRNA (adenine2503-C2)-methyltransferase
MPPSSITILDLSLDELTARIAAWGEPAYRAKQVYDWIYHKNAVSYAAMTSLPKGLRDRLSVELPFPVLQEETRRASKDGTTKFLFDLADHQKVESVLIPTEKRVAACISTQAGCKFGCKFCASGVGGWVRDLTCAEILDQVLHVREEAAKRKRRLSHIVFMGTGEPLDNLSNVFKAIGIINSPQGLKIAARHITISTAGLVPKFKELAELGIQFELAVSLNGYDDASRNALMPINRKYPIKELIAACREYIQETNRQVTFEYILIEGLTCTDQAASELGRLLKGMICKLNLIPCNPVSEFGHKPPTKEQVRAFTNRLDSVGVHFTLRRPRGQDVSAACGQLRHSHSADQSHMNGQ